MYRRRNATPNYRIPSFNVTKSIGMWTESTVSDTNNNNEELTSLVILLKIFQESKGVAHFEIKDTTRLAAKVKLIKSDFNGFNLCIPEKGLSDIEPLQHTADCKTANCNLFFRRLEQLNLKDNKGFKVVLCLCEGDLCNSRGFRRSGFESGWIMAISLIGFRLYWQSGHFF